MNLFTFYICWREFDRHSGKNELFAELGGISRLTARKLGPFQVDFWEIEFSEAYQGL